MWFFQAQLTARGPAGACTDLPLSATPTACPILPPPPEPNTSGTPAPIRPHYMIRQQVSLRLPPPQQQPPQWPQCAALGAAGFLPVCVDGGIVGAGAGRSGGSPCATVQCLGDLMEKRILTRTCIWVRVDLRCLILLPPS